MIRFSPPIKDRPIRFALVGCGRISRNHFGALRDHADKADIAAVCDVDSGALKTAVAATGAPGYGSLAEVLEKSNADIVALATPSGLHPAQAIQVAKAGRHVMTEKPMATRWEDAKCMVQVCDAAGVRLFVVKQNRRNPTLKLLKRAVDKGRFGRIYMVNVNVFWTRSQSYYDSATWHGTWEFDGGAFMNQASHYVDLLDWLIGPVESVQSAASREVEPPEPAPPLPAPPRNPIRVNARSSSALHPASAPPPVASLEAADRRPGRVCSCPAAN